MHAEACRRVSDSAIDVRLLEQIGRCAALTEGADGVRVHHLPASPRQVADDSAMHFAVLGPSAACEPGAPSAEARRFLDEGSGPDRPRVYRNALVLAVPTPEGVELMRQAIRGWLAWRQVGAQLDEERTDAARLAVWKQSVETARRRVAEAIRAAYAVAVAVDPANQVDAYRLSSAGGSGLFAVIRRDPRLRVRDGPVNDQALLPGGPYNLWRDGESARRVKDLVGAFAQYPHLPRMVHRRAIVETIVEGCARGQFVLQRAGRNGPTRSWWFRRPEPGVLDEPDLELALPAGARLAELCPALLEPGVLPNLWDGDRLPLPRAHAYFAGGRVERVAAESDEVEVPIPVADRSLVDRAVSESVGSGRLWLRCGTASVCGDPVPAPLLRDSAAVLAPPPLPLAPTDVVASSIPAAWRSGRSTAAAVATALLERAGVDLPWGTVRAALSAAIGARLVEALPGGAPWPCGSAEAARVELRLLYDRPIPAAGQRGRGAVAEPATVELAPHQIQDLGEQVHRIVRAGAGLGVRFLVRVEAVRRDAAGARAAAEVNRLLAEICPQLRIS
jgi:hypothetical protein